MCSFTLPNADWKQKQNVKDTNQESFPHMQATVVSAGLGTPAIVAPVSLDVERHKVGRIH
jgi:hypothetical protein